MENALNIIKPIILNDTIYLDLVYKKTLNNAKVIPEDAFIPEFNPILNLNMKKICYLILKEIIYIFCIQMVFKFVYDIFVLCIVECI